MLRLKKKESIKDKNLRTNEDLINEFLKSLNSANTKKSYKVSIKRFLKFIKNKNFQLTTKLDLENYFDFLNDSDLRKKIKSLHYTGIKSFFQYFIPKQNIDSENQLNLHFIENPMTSITRRWKNDKENKLRKILTNQEINRVLVKLKKINYRNYVIFYVLADTSMRGNGLVNIEIKNVHLDKRFISTWDKGKMRRYYFGLNLQGELKNYILMRNRMNFVND